MSEIRGDQNGIASAPSAADQDLPPPAPPADPPVPPSDPVLERFREDLRANARPSHVGVRALLLLATAAAFAWSMRDRGVAGLLILVAVLLVHEGGHLLAMRHFGYRNLSMFFLPFFGAAVTGKPTTPSSWQEGVVSLAGPVPGIVLGLLLLPLASRGPIWQTTIESLVFINGLNLLPTAPLDGGRLVAAALFSRDHRLDIAAMVLGGAAFAFLLPMMVAPGFLAGAVLGLALNRYRTLSRADSLRRSGLDFSAPITELPDETLGRLRRCAEDQAQADLFTTRRGVAGYAIALHDLLRLRPATWPQTITLLVVWAAAGGAAWITWDRHQHPRADWHVVEDPSGRWSAEFPARVTSQSKDAPSPGVRRIEMTAAAFGRSEFALSTVTLERPLQEVVTDDNESEVLDRMARNLAQATHRTVRQSRNLLLRGHSTKEVRLVVDGKEVATARFVLGRTDAFMMMVSTGAEASEEQRFFDSLNLHEPPPQPPPPN